MTPDRLGNPNPSPDESLAFAREVLETESRAILGLIPQLDARFPAALDLLNACAGRVVLSGSAAELRSNPAVQRAYLGE